MWNGSNWLPLDIKPAEAVTNIQYFNGNIYASINNANPASFSSINTVTNHGTAEAFPVIYIYGPGRLRWIENQTTHKTIYIDLTILDNEEVYIDFGKKTIRSMVRGDLTYSILPGSDFADFSLAPGDNTLAVLMTDDVDSLMYIYYQPTHWSVSSTVKPEELP